MKTMMVPEPTVKVDDGFLRRVPGAAEAAPLLLAERDPVPDEFVDAAGGPLLPPAPPRPPAVPLLRRRAVRQGPAGARPSPASSLGMKATGPEPRRGPGLLYEHLADRPLPRLDQTGSGRAHGQRARQ